MKKTISGLFLILTIFLLMQLSVIGQDTDEISCDLDDLQATIDAQTADLLEANPNIVSEFSLEYMYRLGEIYTNYALACDYQPTFPEIETQVDRTLDLVPLSFIISASSIGNDVDAVMTQLEDVNGDSFNGQLLYNGLEVGLDGAELGCSGCHNGEAAPVIEGTYTRTLEERLILPELADYTAEQYLVESILHPSAYIAPEYASVQMPANYGGRLDAQQLADLIEYLSSQDQESDSASNSQNVTNDIATISGVDYDTLMSSLAAVEGDPMRGEDLYNGHQLAEVGVVLGCAACHTNGLIGTPTIGTWTRIIEQRLILPEFTDYSPELYAIESIIEPDSYVVEEYPSGIMTMNYGEQLTLQDLADLIAFLRETTQE